MAEAVIVEAVRSPVGKRNGGLSGVHAADLSAQVLNGLIQKAGVDPDPLRRMRDSGGFEPQALNRGTPAGGDEEVAAREPPPPRRSLDIQHDAWAIGADSHDLVLLVKRDAIIDQGPADDFDRLGIVPGQKVLHLHQADFRP